jgi:hypothetical protein
MQQTKSFQVTFLFAVKDHLFYNMFFCVMINTVSKQEDQNNIISICTTLFLDLEKFCEFTDIDIVINICSVPVRIR